MKHIYSSILYISLVVSLYLGSFFSVGLHGFDICNESGIPFISMRGGLCPTKPAAKSTGLYYSKIYAWNGMNVKYVLLNVIVLTPILFAVGCLIVFLHKKIIR